MRSILYKPWTLPASHAPPFKILVVWDMSKVARTTITLADHLSIFQSLEWNSTIDSGSCSPTSSLCDWYISLSRLPSPNYRYLNLFLCFLKNTWSKFLKNRTQDYGPIRKGKGRIRLVDISSNITFKLKSSWRWKWTLTLVFWGK